MASNSKIIDDDNLATLKQLSEQMHKYCWNLKKHLGNSKSQLLKNNAVANEFKSKYSEGANTIKNLETIFVGLDTISDKLNGLEQESKQFINEVKKTKSNLKS